MMLENGSLYGNFRQLKFKDVWNDSNEFQHEYNSTSYSDPDYISQDQLKLIFVILYSNFANSTIASSDLNQFKYKLFFTIWSFAPQTLKKIEIQKDIIDLKTSDLVTGEKRIVNHAINPGTAPSTSSLDELSAINSQDTDTIKRSKVDQLSTHMAMIADDLISSFIDRFRPLFLTVVQPELPLWYISDN